MIEVGDTVRQTDHVNGDNPICKVTKIAGNIVYHIHEGCDEEMNCGLESFELVSKGLKGSEQEIKIGDRVRIVREYPDETSNNDGNDGKIGVMCNSTDQPTMYPYLVELEDGTKLGVHKVELLSSDGEQKSTKENEEVEEEINKMEIEKPSTNLKKNACKKAKEESIESAINAKKFEYREVMDSFLSDEKTARRYRKLADDLKEKLGVTDKEMKELF
ncbi:hypothetical protein LCGC14_1874100 [marine sediment metagenome]|uniref:Uncharacterized protein n=1 Tax=marine sediment metagenome TaxID=412755 RepID=A0A0F9J2V3_9ZZZZ